MPFEPRPRTARRPRRSRTHLLAAFAVTAAMTLTTTLVPATTASAAPPSAITQVPAVATSGTPFAVEWSCPSAGFQQATAAYPGGALLPITEIASPDAGARRLSVQVSSASANFVGLTCTNNGVTDPALHRFVVGAATTTSLSSGGAAPRVDDAVVLTADVSTADGAAWADARGRVDFLVDGVVRCDDVPVSATATVTTTRATCDVGPLPYGPRTVEARFADAAGAANPLPLANSSATTTVTVTRHPVALRLSGSQTFEVGDPGAYLLAGVVSDVGPIEGTVGFAVDGGAPVPAALTLGEAMTSLSHLSAGLHTITVSYPGSATHEPAELPWGVLVLREATVTTLDVVPTEPRLGWSTTATATVVTADGAPVTAGTVQFRVGPRTYDVALDGSGRAGAPVGTAVAGPVDVSASFLGTSTLEPSQASTTVTVGKGDVGSSVYPPAETAYGDPASVRMMIQGGWNAAAPTGTFSLLVDGVPHGEPVPAGTDLVSFALPVLAPGTHPVVVQYSGDANYAPYAAEVVAVVHPATPRLGLATASGATTWPHGTPAAVTTALTGTTRSGALAPTGAVTLSATGPDGAAVIGPDGALDWAPGTYTITASYAGDANYAPATESLTVTVSRATTTTTISGDARWTAGDPAHVTVDVAADPASGPLTGTVVVSVDGRAGSPLALVDGAVVVPVDDLPVGTHSISATYSGSEHHAASTSQAVWSVTVDAIPTMPVLTLDPGPTTPLGRTTTLTATVVRWGMTTPVTVGQVEFTVGLTVTTVDVGADGTASVTVPSHAAGTIGLRADYLGSPVHATSSTLWAVVVSPGEADLQVSAPTRWDYGSPAPLTATLTGVTGADAPTGTLTLEVDGAAHGDPVPVTPAGLAAGLDLLPPGSHTVVVRHSGDASYAPVASEPLTVVVDRAPVTVDAVLDGPATWAFGSPSSVAATVAGAAHPDAVRPGPATLTVTGGVDVAPDGTMPWAPGRYTVTASYPGDAYHQPGEDAVSVTVTAAPVAVALSGPTAWTWEDPAAVTVTVAPGVGATPPTGDVTFVVDGAPRPAVALVPDGGVAATAVLDLGDLPPGEHTVTATYAGDVNYAGATTSPHDVTVARIASTTTITVPSRVSVGSTTTAQVAVVRSGSGAPIGEGSVRVTLAGESQVVALAGDGTASVLLPTASGGPVVVTAEYLGTEHYAGSSDEAAVAVQQVPATVVLSGPAAWAYGTTATVGAEVTGVPGAVAPTGLLTFRLDGEQLGEGRDVTADELAVDLATLEPGTYTVMAVYHGDLSYDWTASAPLTVQVQRAPVAVEVLVQGETTWRYGAQPAILASVQGSVLPGTVAPSPTALLTVRDYTGSVVPLEMLTLVPGPYTVTAEFPGDDRYLPGSASVEVEVLPAEVALAADDVTTTIGTPALIPVTLTTTPATVPQSARVTAWDGEELLGDGTLVDGVGVVALDRALPAGQHDVVLRYTEDDRYAPAALQVTVTVAGVPQHGLVPTSGTSVALSAATARPGAPLTVSAAGFVPGETVVVVLHSEPVVLGTAVADDDGAIRLLTTVPAGTALGDHRIEAVGGSSQRWATTPLVVAVPPAPATPARPATARPALAATGSEAAGLGGVTLLLLVVGLGLVAVGRSRPRAD